MMSQYLNPANEVNYRPNAEFSSLTRGDAWSLKTKRCKNQNFAAFNCSEKSFSVSRLTCKGSTCFIKVLYKLVSRRCLLRVELKSPQDTDFSVFRDFRYLQLKLSCLFNSFKIMNICLYQSRNKLSTHLTISTSGGTKLYSCNTTLH